MKKTIIALMALSGVASADTTWSFEGDLSTTGYTINTSATEVYSYKVKEQVTEGDTTVEKEVTKYGRRAATLTYVDSGLTKGTVIGNYTLDVNKGKAVDLTKVTTGGTKWISLNSTYYTNGDGKLYAGDSGTDFTLMAYVKFDNISGEQFIFGTGSSNEVGLAFGLRDGQLDLLTKYVAHNSIESDNPVTLKADEWYHVAASYNAKNKDVTFYVNGDSIGTVTIDKVNDKYFNAPSGNVGAAIGAGSQDVVNTAGFYGPQAGLDGYLAEVKVFNSALDQQGILKAANLVPEPTTATLSLLALAGLAARRRRR